jgi:hypothetical protein
LTLHEQFKDEKHSGSSDRGFGIVFTVVFSLGAAYLAWHGHRWFVACAGISLFFLIAALLRPGLLAPLNKCWSWLGVQLSKVMTPIILLLLFILCFLPTSLIARLLGKDFLRLKRTTDASYWIARSGLSSQQTDMKNQF